MKFPFFIARRYFFSKYNTSAINIISFVSMLAVMVVTMAMLIIFSSLNGFEGLVKSLYNSFYPELAIRPVHGKVFHIDSVRYQQLQDLDEVENIAQILEEKVLLKNMKKQTIAIIKGVSEEFSEVNSINKYMIRGRYSLNDELDNPLMIIGAGIEARLGVNVLDPINTIKVYMPKRGKKRSLLPNDAFKVKSIYPTGTFSIQQDFDSKYVFVPIKTTRSLLKYPDNVVSSLELKVDSTIAIHKIKEKVEMLYGNEFEVLTRYEMNRTLYQVMNMEGWAVYSILTLILIIAAFNIVGSLIMLVMDKKKDIFILISMGASRSMIRNIFLFEGMLFCGIGTAVGVLLAVFVVLLQKYFEIVPIPGGSFVVTAYPVEMKLIDFILVSLTVIVISVITSWYPSNKASKTKLDLKSAY